MIPITELKGQEGEALVSAILNRSRAHYQTEEERVNRILQEVRKEGDTALLRYTKQFDGAELLPEALKVTQEEITAAYAVVSAELLRVIRRSAGRIRAFHEKQRQNSWLEPSPNGEMLGQMIRPLERVGVYVPGGKAAYPSSVLMNIVPAKVAGVSHISVATPAGSDGRIPPVTLVAAAEAGAETIYKMGGAQAIAALAYGTKTVIPVDKICGPGNLYVALAKKSVYGQVDIDSVAGPSEILVLADESADPAFVAADMLSQAEHDELASAVLVTTSKVLAEAVQAELKKQTAVLSRKEIIEASLKGYGAIFLVKDQKAGCALVNRMAPEHLELCLSEPFSALPLIQNAGAIFLGHYTPEPVGDYMAGPSHVLPTAGTARFFSPLSVDDFQKKTSLLSFSKEALAELADDIVLFAEAEGLTAHANAIRVRHAKG